MIIKKEQSNVTIVGDVQENKVSIDPKNLEYITTLLSSNLYSNPEQSFMREIVSNAWDSHVEAGTTDQAVIITFEDKWVSIRDFGTGLSPERFNEVYRYIGSSTKRESNDFIGSFGIGRFSSLACSNTCHITSYYNGKMYKYLMYKDGNSISIDLLLESDTTEPNGLDVAIQVNSIQPFAKALQYLEFFPNLYVNNKSTFSSYEALKFNSTTTKNYNSFYFNKHVTNTSILLGNVLYPLNTSHLTDDINKLYYSFAGNSSGIVLKFDIGDLTVTPNRENILYCTSTIKKIEEKIKEVAEEVLNLINNALPKDFDNIIEYYKIFHNYSTVYYDTTTNTISVYTKTSTCISIYGNRLIELYQRCNKPLPTYKGKDMSNTLLSNIDVITNIASYSIPSIVGAVFRDKFYNNNKFSFYLTARTYLFSLYKNIDRTIVVVPKGTKLVLALKEFIKSKYANALVVNPITIEDFSTYINSSNSQVDEDIIKDCYDYIYKDMINIDPITNKEYLDFKEARKKDLSKDTTSATSFEVKLYNSNYYSRSTYHYTIDKVIEFYNESKEKDVPYIVTNSRDPYLPILLDIAHAKKCNVLTIPKKYLPYMTKLVGYINGEEVLKFSNPLIKNLYTFYHNNKVPYEHNVLFTYYKKYLNPSELVDYSNYKVYSTIINDPIYCNLRAHIKEIPKDREFNQDIVDLCNRVYNKYNVISNFDGCLSEIGVNRGSVACTFFMVKNKIKIPYKEYAMYLNSCLKIK